MFLDFLTLKPQAFGIDISDLSLKIIKLKRKGKFLGLASFGEEKIRPGIIERGEIKNEEVLSETIREALTKVRGESLKTKYVIASLPEEKSFLGVIQLPPMDEEEAKKAVYFEAESHIPLPINQAYLDSQPILPIYNDLDHLDLLIAAVPRNIADSYVSVLKKSGLNPSVLEIESQALSRALIKREEAYRPILIIDFGATRTSFIIFSGHSLRFTSSSPISSLGFTKAISNDLGVDFNKAEELKTKYGIAGAKEGKRIFKSIAPNLTELVSQVKKYLDYYLTHAHHEHIPPDGGMLEKILLCGGEANMKGISNFISSELKLPVDLGNPWVNILPHPLKEVPELPYAESLRYTTALGLALRGL